VGDDVVGRVVAGGFDAAPTGGAADVVLPGLRTSPGAVWLPEAVVAVVVVWLGEGDADLEGAGACAGRAIPSGSGAVDPVEVDPEVESEAVWCESPPATATVTPTATSVITPTTDPRITGSRRDDRGGVAWLTTHGSGAVSGAEYLTGWTGWTGWTGGGALTTGIGSVVK
jgi:hypothetical protein